MQEKKTKKKLGLTVRIFIGFAIGIIVGLIVPNFAVNLKWIGDIFLNLIKMCVMPLVLCSIIAGFTSITDVSKLRQVGIKTILYFLITTFISGCVGIIVATVINPGVGFTIEISNKEYEVVNITFVDTIKSMVPSNIFASLADGSMLQVIVFAGFFGVALVLLGEKTGAVARFFDQASTTIFKIVSMVMNFAPIGVACLIAASVGQYGTAFFGSLAKFIMTDWIAHIVLVIVLYIPMLKFIAKVPLGLFFKKILRVWAMTTSTCSSAGTLPVSMDVTINELNVEEELAGFTLPLGSTMNMNGAAIYLSALLVFTSQIYGITFTIPQMLSIVFTATLLAVGASGTPGSGSVFTVILLTMMNLPLDIVAMTSGVYRVMDMAHTTANVTGDVVTTLCIARTSHMRKDDNGYTVAK